MSDDLDARVRMLEMRLSALEAITPPVDEQRAHVEAHKDIETRLGCNVRFVSERMKCLARENDRPIGAPLTGLRLDTVEIVCALDEVTAIITSPWFLSIGGRRNLPSSSIDVRITTELA